MTDMEAMDALRDAVLVSMYATKFRSLMPRRLAPNLWTTKLATAFASVVDDDDDDSEQLMTRGQGPADPGVAVQKVMASLEEQVSKTIQEKETKWAEDSLEQSEQKQGSSGGGGVRVRPPKLDAPKVQQLEPISIEMQRALQQICEEKYAGNAIDAGAIDLDEVGKQLLEDLQPFSASEGGERRPMLRKLRTAENAVKAAVLLTRITSKPQNKLDASMFEAVGGFEVMQEPETKKGAAIIQDPQQVNRVRARGSAADGPANGYRRSIVRIEREELAPTRPLLDQQLYHAAEAIRNDEQLLGALIGPHSAVRHTEERLDKSKGLANQSFFKSNRGGKGKSEDEEEEPLMLSTIGADLPGDDFSYPDLKRSESANARIRAEIQAVDRKQALMNRRAKALARREAVAKAKADYRSSVADSGPALEEDEEILQVRSEIQAVDRDQARENMRRKALARREAIQKAREDRQKKPTRANSSRVLPTQEP